MCFLHFPLDKNAANIIRVPFHELNESNLSSHLQCEPAMHLLCSYMHKHFPQIPQEDG